MVPLVFWPVTTRSICAPGATAPDHSTSSEFSVRSPVLQAAEVLVQMMAEVPVLKYVRHRFQWGQTAGRQGAAECGTSLALLFLLALLFARDDEAGAGWRWSALPLMLCFHSGSTL